MPIKDFETTTPDPRNFPKTPPLPFVVHGTLRNYLQAFGIIRPIIILLLMGFLFLFGNPEYALFVLITFIVVITVAAILVSQRQITAESGQLVYRTALFGRKKTIAYTELGEAHVFVNYVDSFAPVPRIIIMTKAGARFASINYLYWDAETVDVLLAILHDHKVQETYYTEPVNSAVLAKRAPQLISYNERHPVLVALYVLIAIIVAVAVFTALTYVDA